MQIRTVPTLGVLLRVPVDRDSLGMDGNSLNLGGRRSTFEGKSALLPSDVIDFAM